MLKLLRGPFRFPHRFKALKLWLNISRMPIAGIWLLQKATNDDKRKTTSPSNPVPHSTQQHCNHKVKKIVAGLGTRQSAGLWLG